jgi:YHS domain-containing protein
MYAWDYYPTGKEYYFGANQNSEGFLRRHPPESDNT